MDDGRVVRMHANSEFPPPNLLPFCSVPISKLPRLVYESQKDIEHSGIFYSVVGHAGDGG